MRFLLALFLCIVSISIGQSQSQQVKPSIMIGEVLVEDNNSAARDLTSKTASLLKKNYYVTKKSPLQVDIAAIPGKAYTINGMDTYTVSDVEVNYTITLAGHKSESKSVSIKCKGSNESDLHRKIGSTISRDKGTRTEVMTFIDEYVKSKLTSCTDVSTLIDKQISNNEPESAYASLAYYELIEGCEETAEAKEGKVLDAIAAKTCKALVHDAKILANGATIRDLTKATDKLLMISPDSPCQQDVDEISKLISANAKEIGTQSSNDINIKLEQRSAQTQAEWRSYYRNKYYQRNNYRRN